MAKAKSRTKIVALSNTLATPPGLGHFTKTLPHNAFGEVDPAAFANLTTATAVRRNSPADGTVFLTVPRGADVPAVTPDLASAPFVNPLAGLAIDRLVPSPETFTMPAPPAINSLGIAAELTELYWMALLRDVPADQFGAAQPDVVAAADELQDVFDQAVTEGTLDRAVDLPCGPITPNNLFRIGLPGEEVGPLISQFFVRDVRFGVQTIDQRMDPYRRGLNFLTTFPDWLNAQNRGRGVDGEAYPRSNEKHPSLYLEQPKRYASCMRDLARFVNKDALHQAYFNAALLLMDGGARWTPGNPYFDNRRRDSGFGTLGGPHILALVSEVATRALETVWFQKWQTYLRLRPEAYAGHLHVQEVGIATQTSAHEKRDYALRATGSFGKAARDRIQAQDDGGLLLPMAFTAGSPKHPSYGAGHASVAGACVTVLKAFFRLLDDDTNPLSITTLANFPTFVTGINSLGEGTRTTIPPGEMTIEGELNKLASNVAMGRTMGGVHWRSDNTRSLILGEAMAAHVLATITTDLIEQPVFRFRTFGRTAACRPRIIEISAGTVVIDGVKYMPTLTASDGTVTSLSSLVDPPAAFLAP